MRRSRAFKQIFPYLAVAGDLALVLAGFLADFYIRFFGQVPEVNWEPFLRVTPWVALATLILFSGLGLYQFRRNGFTSLFHGVAAGIFGVLVATMALTF